MVFITIAAKGSLIESDRINLDQVAPLTHCPTDPPTPALGFPPHELTFKAAVPIIPTVLGWAAEVTWYRLCQGPEGIRRLRQGIERKIFMKIGGLYHPRRGPR